QQLVAAVGERVQRLGEHRARARDHRGDRLRARDQHVRDERLDDLAPGLRHYLIALDIALKSSLPARSSRSNTQTSVEVAIAPARSISLRPIFQFACVRLQIAST